jgi:phage shock protein A
VVAGARTGPVCYTADAHPAPVFENFREALNQLLNRATPPEERRALIVHMRDTLAHAKAGVEDLRDGVKRARDRLSAERRELDTVRRRKRLATDVGDRETVTVAERFEAHHAERVQVLEQKVDVQERELSLAEREVEEMTRALKEAMAGVTPAGSRPATSIDEQAAREVDETLSGSSGADLDRISRARARQERDAEAERRLAELKRRMGK